MLLLVYFPLLLDDDLLVIDVLLHYGCRPVESPVSVDEEFSMLQFGLFCFLHTWAIYLCSSCCFVLNVDSERFFYS